MRAGKGCVDRQVSVRACRGCVDRQVSVRADRGCDDRQVSVRAGNRVCVLAGRCVGRQGMVRAGNGVYEWGNGGAGRGLCVRADRKVFISLNKLCVYVVRCNIFLLQRTGPDLLRSEARAGDSLPDDCL